MQITIQTAAPETVAGHPNQRHFNGISGQPVTARYFDEPAHLRICRLYGGDVCSRHAEVAMRVEPFGELSVHLSPAELRTLATTLLSAAVDIETHPAPAAPALALAA